MSNSEWKLIASEPPPIGQDVLVYSAEAKGYAVAMNSPTGIRNSITGQFFGPRLTHWCFLPEPPATENAFISHASLTLAPNP